MVKFNYDGKYLKCTDLAGLRREWDWRKVKVTGTTFLSLLDKSKHHSAAFALLKKITGYKTIIDPKYSHAGYQYEPVLIEKLVGLKEEFVKHQAIEAREVQFDYFKEDRLFGGIPDMLAFKPNGDVEVVDIKTTGIQKLKYESDPMRKKWAPFISENAAQVNAPDYVFQILLYSYLARKHKNMNVTSCSLFAGFLRPEDYPICTDSDIKYMPINEDMTTRYLRWPYDDNTHQMMERYVAKATEKIIDFLTTGVIELNTIPSGPADFVSKENQDLLRHMSEKGLIVQGG